MSGTGVEAEWRSSDELDERYGRRGLRRGPWIAVIVAVALVLAAIGWFAWARPIERQSALEVTDLAHAIESDAAVSVTWRLVAEPDRPVACALVAMNTSYAIVGWRVVEIPASAETIRDFTEPLRTSERASTGFVYGCWLA